MDLAERIKSLCKLGEIIGTWLDRPAPSLNKLITDSVDANPWFTPGDILYSLRHIASLLSPGKLNQWLSRYPEQMFSPPEKKVIGLMMAGNIPLVGFHDVICVLVTGHSIRARLSSKDPFLLPAIGTVLNGPDVNWKDEINFSEQLPDEVDAVIATGSNNTSRYFRESFGKFPHIFRKNRNGVAVLRGDETPGELTGLAEDIFQYFGLGCRNVSKLFVPEAYPFERLFDVCSKYVNLRDHKKYMNNYSYLRALYKMNEKTVQDTGFLLLKEDSGLDSPVGSLYWESYSNPADLHSKLTQIKNQVQCYVSAPVPGIDTIEFGKSQKPELWDYADNMDTLIFLSNLCEISRPWSTGSG